MIRVCGDICRPHPPPSTLTSTATTPPTTPPAPALIVESLLSSPAFSATPPAPGSRTPRCTAPFSVMPYKFTSCSGSSRKIELSGSLLLDPPASPWLKVRDRPSWCAKKACRSIVRRRVGFAKESVPPAIPVSRGKVAIHRQMGEMQVLHCMKKGCGLL